MSNQIEDKRLINILLSFGVFFMVAESWSALYLDSQFFTATFIAITTYGYYHILSQPNKFELSKKALALVFIVGLVFECILGFATFSKDIVNDEWKTISKSFFVLIPLSILLLLYSPHTVSEKNVKSIREISYLKMFVIALCWSAFTIFPLGIFSEGSFDIFGQRVLLLFASRFVFVMTLAMLSDVCDVQKDRGVIKTWPMVLGKNGAMITALALALLSDLIARELGLSPSFFWPATLSSLPAILLLLVNQKKGGEFAIEAAFVFHALFVIWNT